MIFVNDGRCHIRYNFSLPMHDIVKKQKEYEESLWIDLKSFMKQ